MSRARWVVLPAHAEGQAGTLLEAMSCGCVPIATRESGIDVDRYGGYVASEGSVSSLVEAMTNAVLQWQSMRSKRARELTRTTHSWTKFEQEVAAVSEDLLTVSQFLATLVAR